VLKYKKLGKNMLKTIKNIILVDETQPLEIIKKQYKSKTYWFLGLSWLVSFLLIWIIPQDIMQHGWAKSFVDFMGYIVPMVDGLEDIRLYGPESIKLKERLAREGLKVLPHISFYYAILWAWAWVSVPYMIVLTKNNFKYNKDNDMIGTKTLIGRYHNKKFLYYFGIIIIIIMIVLFAYVSSNASTNWFKMIYIYHFSVGFFSSIFTLHMFFMAIVFIYTHFLIKQQER
jgi:hypothetical protein